MNRKKKKKKMSLLKKGSIDKVRRTTEEKGPRSYKSRNSAEVNVKFLGDGS